GLPSRRVCSPPDGSTTRSAHFGLIQIQQPRIPPVRFGRTSVMTLLPQLLRPLMRPLRRLRQFFLAAVRPATSLNSRADRERIHKPCGSHTLRTPQLLPPPHHSKLADAPCD